MNRPAGPRKECTGVEGSYLRTPNISKKHVKGASIQAFNCEQSAAKQKDHVESFRCKWRIVLKEEIQGENVHFFVCWQIIQAQHVDPNNL